MKPFLKRFIAVEGPLNSNLLVAVDPFNVECGVRRGEEVDGFCFNGMYGGLAERVI